MEQKQLDAEDSYFGEEFIEDEEVKVENANPKKKSKKKTKAAKSAAKVKAASKEPEEKEGAEESTPGTQKEEAKPEQPLPVEPWAEEDGDSGTFKKVSTWKVLTGIAVILLLISVFTQGFQFSDDLKGETLSLTDAENTAVTFVNTHLLQPPFTAEIESSTDAGDLYQVTLSVAGQAVNSYITKDGKLFFPQGFDTTLAAPAGASIDELPGEEEIAAEEESVEELIDEVQEVIDEVAADEVKPAEEGDNATETAEENATGLEPAELEPAQGATEEAVENATPAVDETLPPVGVNETPQEADNETAEIPPPVNGGGEGGAGDAATQLSVAAKRWLFSPEEVTVKKGEAITLTIKPENLDFTFAIPDLGVEEKVAGQTTVTFTPDKVGSFKFMCSSCEAWRGMTGIIVVE